MTKKLVLTLCALMIGLFVFAGVSAAAPATVTIAYDTNLGGYLADGNGNTLYYFTKDGPGISECKGNCAVNWPSFYTASIVPAPGLEAGDFGTMIRSDGNKQTTFRGFPLYYFAKDNVPGDIKGHKFNNVWFVVPVN